MAIYDKYNWLWKDDKESAYKKFIAGHTAKLSSASTSIMSGSLRSTTIGSSPSIEDFENELKKFLYLEQEIAGLPNQHIVGVLSLQTSNLKIQLCNETKQWRVLYSQKVYMLAKEAMNNLHEYMRVVTNKLNIPVQSLDNLGYVM